MKLVAIFLVIILGVSVYFGSAHAETLEFGMRLVPTKIIETTESKLEIFTIKNGKIFPQPIEDFAIISQNPDLLEIIGKDSLNGFNMSVLIDPKKPGNAKISLAANGYKSTEFTITIHQNIRNEKNIILKAIPDSFTVNGPKTGFLSVELLDEDGNPIVAKEDIDVKFSTSNDNSIKLNHNEFTIKKGSYYKVQKFEIKSFDNPITVFAKTQNMPVAQKKIDVIEPNKPYTLQLYISPEKSTSDSIGSSYAIVQLQDDEGEPVLATRDIPISIKVESPFDDGLVLTDRGRVPQITFENDLMIREGTYWDSVGIITNAGIEGTYDIGISAKGFDVSASQTLELVEINDIEEPNIAFDPLPVLMAGGEQLVGVVHLQDDAGVVMLADSTLDFRVLGSEKEFLPKPNHINKLETAAQVIAKLGYTKPEFLTIHETLQNNILTEPELFGPTENSLQLRSEPLIDKIKANTVFPVVNYVVDNDGSAWYFPEDDELFLSPSEIVTGPTQRIHAGSPSSVMELFANEEGSETLLVQTGKMTTQMKINTHNILSSKLNLDVPQRIFEGVTSEIIFQMTDSQGDPIFANTDVVIDAISNDESILKFDEQIKIKRGESFTIVDITPTNVGSVELALLATGFPLTTEVITIDNLKPQVKFHQKEIVDANSIIDSTILVTFDGLPMGNIPVSWNVTNGIIQAEDSVTGNDGTAKVIVQSGTDNIKISAKVTSDFLPPSSALQTIKVNATGVMIPEPEYSFELLGKDAFILIVPTIAIVTGVFLQKKNLIKINKTNSDEELIS